MILARILKQISILALLSLGLPFIVFFETIRYGRLDLIRLSVYILAILISAFLGLLMQRALSKVDGISTAKRRIILGAVMFALLLVLGFALRQFGALFIITMSLTSMYSFIIISWSYGLNYGEILSKKMLIVFLITNVFGLIISRLIGGSSLNLAGIIVMLTEIAIVALAYAIVANQQNIDFQLSRRNNTNEQLPPRIRQFNLILVFAVIAIAIFSIVLVPIIVYAMRSIINLGILGIRSLLSLFIDTGNSGEIGQGIQLPPGQGHEDIWQNPIIYLLELMAVFGILYLIIRFRKQIIGKILEVIKKLIAYISDILNRQIKTENSIADRYYYDETIKIGKSEVSGIRQQNEMKIWRKKYRKYKKDDSGEKFLIGYRLMREYHLITSKTWSDSRRIKASDTPYEGLAKLSELPKYDEFANITDGYSYLYYGGIPPTDEVILELDRYLHLAYKNKI